MYNILLIEKDQNNKYRIKDNKSENRGTKDDIL